MLCYVILRKCMRILNVSNVRVLIRYVCWKRRGFYQSYNEKENNNNNNNNCILDWFTKIYFIFTCYT